jgi:trehalose utilization protein
MTQITPNKPIRVTVWHEFLHEKTNETVSRCYPQGMHTAIAEGLHTHLGDTAHVRTATLDQPDHGLTDDVLTNTDVLLWWGHKGHAQVDDQIVEKVHSRVHHGMGLIVLHSGHYSKIFVKLMGTGCGLRWREAGEMERVWCVNPGHPIATGLDPYFEIAHSEMYGEFFDVPPPEELVFISWFEGGDVFRSGCCWTRGKGKIFYFSPGHELYPIYYDPNIRRVIANAVRYVTPRSDHLYAMRSTCVKQPLNPIRNASQMDESLHKPA